MSADIDDSGWPLVLVRWHGQVNEALLSHFLARMDTWLERGERFALVIDARGAPGFSPEVRARLLQHMRQNAERTARLLIQAAVLDSVVQRTLFHAVNLMFPRPFPSRAFADPNVARSWALALLAEMPAGVATRSRRS